MERIKQNIDADRDKGSKKRKKKHAGVMHHANNTA